VYTPTRSNRLFPQCCTTTTQQSVVVVQENTCTVSAGKKDAVSLYYVDLQLDLAELASYSTSTISR